MFIQDDELRAIFKTASEEHLQNLDSGLLHLEKQPDDAQLLESLLRDAHSLKGDANMLGVKDIGTLAHQIEHVLSQLKLHQQSWSLHLGDRLAQGIVAMRRLVHEAVTGEPSEVDTFHVLAGLMEEKAANGAVDEGAIAVDEGAIDKGECEEAGAEREGLGEQIIELIEPLLPVQSVQVQPEQPVPLDTEIVTPVSVPRTSPIDTYRIDTIRVPTQNLDSLMTQAGELTVTKIRIAHRLAEVEAIVSLWEEWGRDLFNHRFVFEEAQRGNGALHRLEGFHNRTEERLESLGNLINDLRGALYEDTARLELVSDELESGIRTLRLLPLATIFNLFPRMVRDLARQQGKVIDLVLEGTDTRADKRILEEMKDPLMHLLRNAIDHGIEPPAVRVKQGKPASAMIRLRGYQTSTSVVIEIQDDGRGLDLAQIQQTALKRGICREEDLAVMTSNQIQSLIFAPGFSTAPLVTEVSGRGVGLDVVRTNVEKLKGNIQIESTPGKGCLFRISLGITLATAHVLIVQVEGMPYAIPVEFVRTACLVEPHELFTIEGRDTILRDNQPISVSWLSELLELAPAITSPMKSAQKARQLACVILQVGQEQLGVFVDTLIDEQDVVIKPQSKLLQRVRNVSGATILGTGEVCMVLNPQDLMKSVRQHTRSIVPASPTAASIQKQTVLLVEDSIATRTQEKRILESAGFEVITAVDGMDGFNKLQSRSVDAIVSDVQMPNLDGLGLAAKIRQHKEYDELPIVLVTSLASDEDKRRGAEVGANAYITKGNFNQDLLIETLQRLI